MIQDLRLWNNLVLIIEVDLANGKNTEDPTVIDDPGKNMRQEDIQSEGLTEGLEHSCREKSFQCAFLGCNKRFSRQGDLNRHSKMHSPGKFPCTFSGCGKVFYRKDKLRQHWEKEHAESQLPSALRSSRRGKDHDGDGNSRSNGFSRSGGVGPDGRPSDQSSDRRKSDTSGSSSSGYASGSHYRSSRSGDTDSEIDVDDETDTDSEIDVKNESDADTKIYVDSESSVIGTKDAENESNEGPTGKGYSLLYQLNI